MKSEIESMPKKSAENTSQDVTLGYTYTKLEDTLKGWKIKKIGDFLKVKHGKSQHNIEILGGKDPILATGGEIGRTNKPLYEKPSVLIGRKGTIDKPMYISKPFWTIDTLFYTEIFENACPKFVYYQFCMIHWKRYNEASGLPSLNANTIENIYVKMPTKEEQKAIAEALSDVDSLIESLDKLIDKKKAIKKATMQQLLTGKTRLPGFTEPWETKRLGDFAEIIMGQSPSSTNYNTSGHGMPLIQGNADIINRKTVKRIYTTEVTKKGKHGDIIMSVRAPVGEISFAKFDICLGRGVCAIRYKNNFLYYYLISIEPKWNKWSKGSTFDSINSKEIKELPISIPPSIDEQKAIAKILSDMDAEIEALEKRKEKTEQMKHGMMQQLLTGKIRLVTSEGTL